VNRKAEPGAIASNRQKSQVLRTGLPQAAVARLVMTEPGGGRRTGGISRFPPNGTFQAFMGPSLPHSPFIYDELAGADEISHCGRHVCQGTRKNTRDPQKGDGAQAGSGLG